MSDEKIHIETRAGVKAQEPIKEPMSEPISERAIGWAQRMWRPVGTGVAVLLALLVTWHVVKGNHGLSVWQHERTEDKQLQQEIQALQQENSQMQQQIDRLKNDPDAIERAAREKLHYAKPGEVIYTLPDAGTGK
jgi:cell division protein FtsB